MLYTSIRIIFGRDIYRSCSQEIWIMKRKEYTEQDIQVLSDRDHVRLRTSMYLGNTTPTSYLIPSFSVGKVDMDNVTFIPAVYKCVGEILDNSVDELVQSSQSEKNIYIESNSLLGSFIITDNGRGVPIGIHETGRHTPEVVFSQLRSGRNFGSDRDQGVIGLNGVGSSAVNFCSSSFLVSIRRDKKHYLQEFSDGTLKKTKPSIHSTTSGKTGTSISFTLDEEIFSDISLPDKLVRNRAIEIAASNPGFVIHYNKEKFKFKNGFEDLIKKAYGKEYFRFSHNGLEFFVVYQNQGESQQEEKMFTWVNSSPLFDGGICNTQFLNAFCDKVTSYLTPLAKKQKAQIQKTDVKSGLIVFGSIKLKNPEYDSQSKTRLIGPTMRKEIDAMLETQWKSFSRSCKGWLDKILELAVARHSFESTRKALKDHTRQLKRKIPELLDANSRDRSECRLLITEGLSAASSISEVRDPNIIASFPLSGKINNVYGCTISELLGMGKLQNLLSAIGLVPGIRAHIADLRYGKIVIATDADFDGNDIFTLLVNMFYTYWPDLFNKDLPLIYRLRVPNVVASKGKSRIHFRTLSDFEKNKEKYSGWTIDYMKGLGSMVPEDWKMILSTDNSLIPIVDDGKMKETLQLLFSPDADARKVWLCN